MLELVIGPIIIALITQAIKLLIDGIPNNFNWQHLLSDYGGMPSSHTAFVTSLTTLVALREGLDSAAFAVSLGVMLVVIRDAVGFRREIGRNAAITNSLATATTATHRPLPKLNEQVGHTVPETIVGFIVGAVLAVVLHLLWIF